MSQAPKQDGGALYAAAVEKLKPAAEMRAAIAAVLEKAAPAGTPPAKAVANVSARLARAGHGAIAVRLAGNIAAELEDMWPLANAGDALARAGDAAQTLAAARALIKRSPTDANGPRLALKAYIARRQWSEAATLLAGLDEALRRAPWVLRGEIALATEHKQAERLQLLAAQLIEAEPQSPDGPVAMARAHLLRGDHAAAQAAISAARARQEESPALLAAMAEIHVAQKEYDAALACYASMREKFAQSPLGYEGAARTLITQKLYNAAEDIAVDGLVRFSRSETLLRLAAEAAKMGKRPNRESHYWDLLAAQRPTDARVALNAVEALLRRTRDWAANMDRAMQKLAELHVRFPKFAAAYLFRIKMLRLAQRYEEADAALTEACMALPDDIDLSIEQAAVLNERGLTGGALLELEELRAKFPKVPRIEAAYVRTLSSNAKYDLAEAAIQTALAELPPVPALFIEYARISSLQGNWDLAAERLAEGLARLSDDELLLRQLERVQTYAQLPDAERLGGKQGDSSVLQYFQTMGGTRTGCEFGLAHRRMGVDRVCLLRWAMLEPAQLIDALNRDFEGAGSEEQTQLEVVRWSAKSEEYWTSDKIYGMGSHTFVRPDEIDHDRMFKQTCRRIKFLAGRMLEDLREGGIMYVFKARFALEIGEIEAIHDALRRHGDNGLLLVSLADADHPAGTVVLHRPGLVLGYISCFMDSGPGGVRVDEWRALCLGAAELWPPPRAAAAAAQEAAEAALAS